MATTSHLDAALDALTTSDALLVAVVDTDRRVQGTLAISDVMRAYQKELRASLQPPDRPAAGSTILEIDTAPDPSLVSLPADTDHAGAAIPKASAQQEGH